MTDSTKTTSAGPHLDAALSVNDMLRLHPPTAAVFNALAIDACCGGDRSLSQAAREDGVELGTLLTALRWTLADLEPDA